MLDEHIWTQILELWNHPRLLPPFLHKNAKDAPKPVQKEIAAFVYEDRRVHINLEHLCEELGTEPERVHSVAAHEVGHHSLIPHSPEMALRLTAAANCVLKNWSDSQFIENIFDDMIDNTYIVENSEYFGRELITTISRMEKMKKERFGQLYLRSYENLWKLAPGTLVPETKDAKLAADAQKIAAILSDSTYQASTWPAKIENIAHIMKDYLPKNPSGMVCRIRAPGELGNINQALQEIAKEMDINDFQKMCAGLGLGTPDFANEQYYLGLARQYSIKLPETEVVAGEMYPHTPKTWLPSDPVNKLNVPYTLQMFGKIIPGVTTRQWDYKQGVAWKQSKEHPDLAIVLDSSGSMPKPNKTVSYPVLSSFVAAESALEAGCSTAVINFSGEGQFVTVPYTQNRDAIHDGLHVYFNGGTEFPSEAFLKLISGNRRKQHILMISDGGVCNPDDWLGAMQKGIERAGSGTLFLSGVEDGAVKELKNMGYRVWPMNSDRDLLRVVEAEAHELYGG